MSGVRDQLLAQLQHFDDDAFAALANRGLLRRARKDLEKQVADIVEDSAEVLVVAFGEYRIRFDARGPAQAQCSCPAGNVCQHILAAAIALQQAAAAAPADTLAQATVAVEEQGASSEPLTTLHEALLRINAADLLKHGGKAAYRWAWQFVQDLDLERDFSVGGERHVVIAFAQPRITFRYMGGAVGALLADVEIAQLGKYQVAAVLAYQRAHDVALTPPETSVKARAVELDLGRDHAAPQSAADTLRESRIRLRASTRQLLSESVELGLSHLSRGIGERYTTLAVWADGAEYYRLGLLLRRLADHVELLLARAGAADEHRLLDEMTLASALVTALEQADSCGAAPAHLLGRARSSYQDIGTLELLGLGASAWRSASGYVGLTQLFWSPAERAFFSCTDARPELQRGFNPTARYQAPGPWSGLGAPMQATGRRIVLTHAQVNAQGRLSAAQSTTAAVQPLSAQEFVQQLAPFTHWHELSEARAAARRSLLAEPQPLQDWAALQPAHWGVAQFDANRQMLVWPLFDADDAQLDVELPYSEYTSHAIARLEQLATTPPPAGSLLIARVRTSAGALVAEPLSLVRPDVPHPANPVDALFFDPAPAVGFVSKWLQRLRPSGRDEVSPLHPIVDALPAVLREIRHGLQRQAERGTGGETGTQWLAALDAHAARAATAGLGAFARNREAVPAARLLIANYLYLQYERLISGADTTPD